MVNASVAATPRKNAKVRLRVATFEDYEQIAALESRCGLDIKSYEDWSHLWLANPLYRELQPDWPIGWVLEDERAQIVGSMGNIPLPFEFEGGRILAASGRGWAAEPAYRSISLILLERLVNQTSIDLYLNNTVGSASLAPVLAFGCSPVPVGLWNESAFWITDYRGFANSIVAARNEPLRSLGGPLAITIRIKTWLAQKALPKADAEVRAEPGFDQRFDDFWEKLKRRNPSRLLAVRSREILRWHFQPALEKRQLWIATVPDGAGIAAYATFDRKDNPATGLRRARLVDFQSLDGSTALLAPVLSWALIKCREEGIHILENTGRWLEDGEFIRRFAPHRRKLPGWTYYYRTNHPRLAEKLQNRCTWAPSLFDGDAGL
jgi:hypothetical protein